MHELPFTYTNQTNTVDRIGNLLQHLQFTLGGNWDYEHGYFDRSLEENHMQFEWLRIPFTVVSGTFEGNLDTSDVMIRIGTPFVLCHRYQNGLDHEAKMNIVGALWDQFQSPVDADAPINLTSIEKAKQIVHQIEMEWKTVT